MTIDDYAAKYGEDYPFVKWAKGQDFDYFNGLSSLELQLLHIGFNAGREYELLKDNKRLEKEVPTYGAIEEVN